MWLECASDFILKYIYSDLEEILKNANLKDHKSLLQEYSQWIYWITPVYNILSEVWADHDKVFTCWVYLKDIMVWTWTWSSKKKAQEQAAKDAYILCEKGECPYKK